MDYIAATIFVYAQRQAAKEHLELERAIIDGLNRFDPDLHGRIRAKIKEANWILLEE